VSSGSYSVELDLTVPTNYTAGFVANFGGGTTAGAEAALIAGLTAGTAYFNVHTDAFPAGEIRGFPTLSVAEPPSHAVLLLGLGGMGWIAWRRKKA
jgi:hypothetical protein